MIGQIRRRSGGGGAVDGHQIAQVRMPQDSYMDTGYYPNNTTKVEFGLIPMSKSAYGAIFNGRTSNNVAQFSIEYNMNVSQLYVYCGTEISTSISVKSINLLPSVHYDIEFSDLELVVNGTSYTYGAGQTFASANTLKINWNGDSYGCESIFDYFKIYDGYTLVRDYVPWIRSNGVVGMLDRVNNRFYSSESTIAFTDNTIELPSGYTRLNYISATGEQRFTCGFTPNYQTNYKAVFMFSGSNAWKNPISSKVSSSSRAFELANGTNTSPNSRLYFRYNNGTVNYNISHGDAQMTFFKSENHLYIFQGQTYKTDISRGRASFAAPLPLTIGCENTNGAYASYFVGDIYELDFFGKEHYIPCISPNNEVGMYDVMNGVLKVSETSTPFIAGTIYGQ